MAGSEIARLLQKIREEEEAARRGLEGIAIVAQHAFINTKMDNVGRYFCELADLTGSKDTAMGLIIAVQDELDSTTTPLSE